MMDFFSMLLARAGISGGGGGGFTPTDEQLAAMNSGITAEKLTTDENNISSLQTTTQGIDSTGDNFIEINGVKLYFGSTTPSNPSDGDWWLD